MQLGKNATKKLGKQRPDNVRRAGGWEAAIADAEHKIYETKARLGRLKAALSFCKESLSNGDPFPAKSAKQKGEQEQASGLFGLELSMTVSK